MKNFRIKPTMTILTIVYFGFTVVAPAVILDFELPPVPLHGQDAYGAGRSYLEDGFRLRTTSDPSQFASIIRFNPIQEPNFPSNGTIHFGATLFSQPLLDRADDAAFSITQIDLAHYSRSAIVPTVAFRGQRADGSVVNATATLGPTFDSTFDTFQFGPEWSNLRSFSFLSDRFAWDNIVVAPQVPEPSAALLGIGLLSMIAFGRLPLNKKL